MKFLWLMSLVLLPLGDILALERLHYKVKFGFLTAGRAEITFNAQDTGDYDIKALAWTDTSLFDLKERLLVTGKTGFKPSVFTMQQIENDYRALKTLRLEGENGVYQKNGNPKEIFARHGAERDYLSALFNLRSLKNTDKFKAGQVIVENVVGLNTAYRMELKVVKKRELYTAGLGNQLVWELRPVFVKLAPKQGINKDWRLYITADERRIPVRITAKLKFGSFNAWLDKYENSARGDGITSFAPQGLQNGSIFPK